MPAYWLIKSEPSTYGLADLERDGRTSWDGVRNYQARNYLRDGMKPGDLVLFYHSGAAPPDRPGVTGVARVSRAAYPDPAAAAPAGEPDTWYAVEVEFVERFPQAVSLDAMRATPELEGMLVLRRGQRLSVQPVEKAHFEAVRRLGRAKPAVGDRGAEERGKPRG